jgi:hypothetical protein
MMHKIPNCPNVVTQLPGEQQSLTHQAPDPLPQGIVEALHIAGFASFLPTARCRLLGRIGSYASQKSV